ncbi:MAG TPA: DUF4123 domain-containing protein [Kofleriaceae bacterium]|jgi:hypothetical protein
MMHDGIRDYWLRYLQRLPGRVYAILDAARGARTTAPRDVLIPELPDVSPFVVAPTARELRELVFAGWGNAWGIFATSTYSRDLVVAHAQQLLHSQLASGERVLFRFYDPRVLRAVAPACSSAERDELLGPFEHLVIEAHAPTAALDVTREPPAAVGVAA